MARVLIAEDQDSVREFLARSAALFGHECVAAQDGLEAYDMLRAGDFDLLISDIRMPQMDGISLALAVRAELPYMKILLITGFSGELERARNIGELVDGILAKPFSVDVLRDAVNRLLPQNVSGS